MPVNPRSDSIYTLLNNYSDAKYFAPCKYFNIPPDRDRKINCQREKDPAKDKRFPTRLEVTLHYWARFSTRFYHHTILANFPSCKSSSILFIYVTVQKQSSAPCIDYISFLVHVVLLTQEFFSCFSQNKDSLFLTTRRETRHFVTSSFVQENSMRSRFDK